MESIRLKIEKAAENVKFTYVAHWVIVSRLKRKNTFIKVTQIILTAITTCGIVASLATGIPWLSWLGAATSALALSLNLYNLNFNLPEQISKHMQAANELWEIREKYTALLSDFDSISNEDQRRQRDELTELVSKVNKTYPGTEDAKYDVVIKNLSKYQ